MDNLSFSDWLQNELVKNELTQAELARRAGVNRQVISTYINQQRNKPDEDVLKAIARGFRLPVETVYRAAGLLPPADEITESVAQLYHVYKQLSPRDQAEILDIIKVKLEHAQQEQERQRAARRIKTGPLPGLGG